MMDRKSYMVFHLVTFALTWKGQIEVMHISKGATRTSRVNSTLELVSKSAVA